MNISAAFIAFSGLELLKPAIMNAREIADNIIVVWQEMSNRGEPAPKFAKDLLHDLHKDKVIDNLIIHNPSKIANNPQEIIDLMIEKRNIAIDAAKQSKFVTIRDCDEFYNNHNHIIECLKDDPDIIYSKILEYIKLPIYQAKSLCGFYVPTIQKSKFNINRNGSPNFKVDPARRTVGVKKQLEFDSKRVAMHHMTRVRYDEDAFNLKYNNHSWYPKTDYIRNSLDEINNLDKIKNDYNTVKDEFGIIKYWEEEFKNYL